MTIKATTTKTTTFHGRCFWPLSCSWHQTTNLFSPNHEYFLTKLCVMIILMMLSWKAPSRFRKGRLISIQKFRRKQKMNEYFVKKIVDWWIGGLMSRTRYMTKNVCLSFYLKFLLYFFLNIWIVGSLHRIKNFPLGNNTLFWEIFWTMKLQKRW